MASTLPHPPRRLPVNRSITLFLLPLLLFGLVACGGSSSDSSDAASSDSESQATQVGPVQSVDLGPIDDALAAQGEEIFDTRCKTCHKLDEEHIGPTLRDVAERRDPVYIMNMILAPEDMIQNHPTGQKLFAEYGTMMTNQNLSRDQARSLLEYFRKVSEQDAPGDS